MLPLRASYQATKLALKVGTPASTIEPSAAADGAQRTIEAPEFVTMTGLSALITRADWA